MTSAKGSVAHGYTPALDVYTLHSLGLGAARKVLGAVHDLFPSVQEVYPINLNQKGLETYRTGTKTFGYTPGTFGQPLELKNHAQKYLLLFAQRLCNITQ
jgi:hypothetical protein